MKVLIIGGGDGGIARELDRYSAVKEVVLCEIDEVLQFFSYCVPSHQLYRAREVPAVSGMGKVLFVHNFQFFLCSCLFFLCKLLVAVLFVAFV